MQYKSLQILSTRPLEQSLLQKAAQNNMTVEVQSLITTKPVACEKLKAEIAQLAQQHASVAITSINAAKALTACMKSGFTNWNIFTIGTATGNYISEHFGGNRIAGTAENASSLAEIIIHEQVKNLLYFCGNQRRDELPQKLSAADVQVQEIVVYETVYTAIKTNRLYDGILFFSPGAVQSFFSVNTVAQSTVLFAIGTTTAESIHAYSNNAVVVSMVPSADALVEKAINYFATTNLFHEPIEE